MALTYFTVTGQYEAQITDTNDAGTEPNPQGISALVTFTPSVKEVQSSSEGKVIRLQPVLARLEDDGILKTLDGDTGIKLVANSAALGPLPELTYTVEFSHTVYDQRKGENLDTFTFTAPSTATTINLATVARLT